jgi:beta-lactamase regulating signal transducer with metallopeptidase domain
MSAEAVAVLNQAAAVALEHLWRACWQGGLAIGLVWGGSRLFPSCPAGVRCWLWRLAYLKLLAALAWGGAWVELPLLPAAPVTGASGHAMSAERRPTQATYALPERWSVASPSAGLSRIPALSEGGGAGSADTRSRRTLPGAAAALVFLWLAGVSWRSARTAREWRASRSLARKGILITDGPLVAECARVCRRLGLKRAPRLWLSDEAGSPVLVGAARPAICLAPSLVRACTASELRLVMAHELAHLKRRDLLWAWLPSIAGWLFFFHPLVWLAGREWRLAQELACDELAIRVTGAPALEYGQMVLKVAAQRRAQTYGEPAVASAAGAYQNLRRRLEAIQQFRPGSSRRQRLAGAVLLAAGIAVTVPWRATARADGAPQASLSTEQRQAEKQERLRQQAHPTPHQRLAEQEQLRRLEVLAHERRMAEQQWHRQQELLAHERRVAEQNWLRRRATEAHERRLAELEHARRLAVRAHAQREAVLNQQRMLEKLAHERRLNHQEYARLMASLTAKQQQAMREDARRLEEQLQRHRQQAKVLQQQLEQQQRQMAATQAEMQSLVQQLEALRAQQQVLEASRHELDVMTLRQRAEEQKVHARLQRLRSRRAPGRSGDRKSSP